MEVELIAQESVAQAVAGASRGELLLAIGSLTAAIGVLWRMMVVKQNETEELLTTKWDECEKGHENTRCQLLEMVGQVGEMRGKLEALSAQVLRKVSGDGSGREDG